LGTAATGYARVSTNGQDLALQEAALNAAGGEKVYAGKISGARSNRPQLARMLKAIGAGEIVAGSVTEPSEFGGGRIVH
jgi:DNA invertase Pin-like site-specific DNA recombinase